MSSTTYRQLVLRLPDGLKQAMRERVESGFGRDGVELTTVKQENRRKCFFTMNGKTYPARLVDLPCILETQKTLDKKTFKSGDIGRKRAYKRDGGSASGVGPQNFFPDGLTPPTKNIVRRRFLKARPAKRKISQTELGMEDMFMGVSGDLDGLTQKVSFGCQEGVPTRDGIIEKNKI